MAGRRLERYLCTVSVILLALCALSGCRPAGYKTFTLKKGIGHFSFEYSASYRITRAEVRDDEEYKYTDIGLMLRMLGGE